MKRVVLISFDICRSGEPGIAFSVGSLLSALRSDHGYGEELEVSHLGYNLYTDPELVIDWSSQPVNWDDYDFVAVSCYVWAHDHARSLMRFIKQGQYKSQIIAGGYQVSTSSLSDLRVLYPDADFYVPGYAERSLIEIVKGKAIGSVVKTIPDWSTLPSPYISGIIALDSGVESVRTETKRGCPYACTFCAQHDTKKPKAHYHVIDKIEGELSLFKQKMISRINVTDPVFNMGQTYHSFLEVAAGLSFNGTLNFQVRPELIAAKNDVRLLDLLVETDSEIELGIQTFDPEINRIIKRANSYPYIMKAMQMLSDRKVRFGISLIYGLPGQTVDSFRRDIDLLHDLGVSEVVAFPLMLLPGTELYLQREELGMVERPLGDFNIPHVIAGPGFSEADWLKMHELALSLNYHGRLF